MGFIYKLTDLVLSVAYSSGRASIRQQTEAKECCFQKFAPRIEIPLEQRDSEKLIFVDSISHHEAAPVLKAFVFLLLY